MRILLVTETLVFGGAETFVLRLARRLLQDGHDAAVLCLNPDHEDPRLVVQFPEISILRVPTLGLRSLKRADRMCRLIGIDLDLQQRRAARWVERHLLGRYDVHHTNLFGADWLFTRLKRRHPAMKIVSTLHGDYALYASSVLGTERTRVLNWRGKLAETLAAIDQWVTISRAQRRQFETEFGVDPARLVAIANGYAPPTPIASIVRPIGQLATFVMVARGMREKGWGFLVDAFGRLKGDRALLLIGEGAYLDRLREQHGENPLIRFAGAHPNPVELIGGADIFVHPSIYKAESLPTVIIEALYAGLPVIATDVGEVAGMIATPSGELAGMLVAPDEATLVDELTTAMQAYLDDPELRRRHAALTAAAFAKFDMERCADAYLRLYAASTGEAAIAETTSNH